MQTQGQMPRLITDDLSVAFIPDDHRAGTACLPGPDPFIVTSGQAVVLDRYGKPPDTGIQRWPLGNRPRPQDLAGPDPEIEMQRRRVMELHHEPETPSRRDFTAGPLTARTLSQAGAVARMHPHGRLLSGRLHDEAAERRACVSSGTWLV